MALSFDEVNILGQILNNTFGKPSTQTGYSSADSGGDPRYGGYTSMDIGTASTVVTKGHVSGDSLCITSLAVINLGMHGDQHKNLNNAINELDQHIDKFTKVVKSNFKKKEHAGRALKCKEIKDSRTTDVQDINFYAETRKAYVIRKAYFEIS